ncbi:hypothetical protein CEXT_520651, partial [Caerostris extrusa]
SEQTAKERKDRAKGAKSGDFPVNGLPDRQTGTTQVAQSGTNPLYFQGPSQFKTITWAVPKAHECCSKRWSKKEMNKKKKLKELRGLFGVGVLFLAVILLKAVVLPGVEKVQLMEKVEACLLYS